MLFWHIRAIGVGFVMAAGTVRGDDTTLGAYGGRTSPVVRLVVSMPAHSSAGHEAPPVPAVEDVVVDFLAGKDVRGRHVADERPHFFTVEEVLRAPEGHRSHYRTASTASRFIFLAHAFGVAQGSASGSSTGAPRAIRNCARLTRPHRQAHPSGVVRSKSSLRSSRAPWSSRSEANLGRSSSGGPWCAARKCSAVWPNRRTLGSMPWSSRMDMHRM